MQHGRGSPEFRGPAPHDLGLAEIATARCVSKNIEMTLHVVDDWHRPTPQIVRVQITSSAARSSWTNSQAPSQSQKPGRPNSACRLIALLAK